MTHAALGIGALATVNALVWAATRWTSKIESHVGSDLDCCGGESSLD
jgi:hypothetical protein